jgi:protein-cysteine N-palmitoyltransferase HHAT
MSVFSFVRRIYALDTLDTRFISSTSTPHKSVVDTRSDSAVSSSKKANPVRGAPVRTDSNGRPKAQPSKWNTLEFYFYYFIFIITVPYMFWVAYDVSRREYVRIERWPNI